MQTAFTKLSVAAALALNFTAAPAAAQDNVFNADLSEPVIEAAVTEFESVCLPFIAHESELTQEQDREVFRSRMLEQGYAFEGEKKFQNTFSLNQFQHTRTSCPFDLPEPLTEGKYTTFFGKAPEPNSNLGAVWVVPETPTVVQSTSTIVSQTCEILPVSITPTRPTNFLSASYKKTNGQALSAYLTWQEIPDDYLKGLPHAHASKFGRPATIRLKTTFLPASNCQINTSGKDLNPDLIKTAIIEKDADWVEKPLLARAEVKDGDDETHFWTQCTRQDEEYFVYSVYLKNTSLAIKVETLQDDKFAETQNCKAASGAE